MLKTIDLAEIYKITEKRAERLLFAEADAVRKEYCGDKIHLRAIIEFSNYCSKDCFYCGLRNSNSKILRYRMSEEEIYKSAQKAVEAGIKTVVLQSGEESSLDMELFCNLISKIKKNLNCAVTVSIGEKSREEYKMLREAGADRYLLKFETSDEGLFSKIKPDSLYSARMNALNHLQSLGFQTGSGNIVGLPGQSEKIIADDISLIKKLNLDMVSITPFIPHQDTPFAKEPQGDLILTLKTLASTRIATRNAHMPATTAIGSIDNAGYAKALSCGANVIMPNFTPGKYRKDYSIYPGKICFYKTEEEVMTDIVNLLKDLRRPIADGCGDSLKKK